jgi:selenocysteine lyase/cysteine desulfurase
VITAGKEYPANIYPWMNLAKKGVELILIPEKNGAVQLTDIEKAIDANVKMVTISFVAWCSGYKNDLTALGKLCNEHNIPLIVDGAQGIGALKLSMQETGVSALACPAWKWMWGPLGLGFLYMKPSFMEKISQVFVGADGVENAEDPLTYNLVPKNDMRRFEYATKNYADIVQFSKSLELIKELGPETIETALHNITARFKQAVTKNGGIIFGDFIEKKRSGIFSFTLEGMDPKLVMKKLAEENITVNERDNRIRIAPHVYLDEGDVSYFESVLKMIRKS